jgi:hypothetical protein
MTTISEIATNALAAADGDVVRATDAMVTAVMNSKVLYRSLMDPLVKQACYDAIRGQCRAQRRVIWETPQPSASSTRDRIGGLAAGLTLMDFPLPGGIKVGDATRAEVMDASDSYLAQATDNAAKGRWLRLIARHVTGDAKVRDVLTLERLIQLQNLASNEHSYAHAA